MDDIVKQMYENVADPMLMRSARETVQRLQRDRNLSFNDAMEIVVRDFSMFGRPITTGIASSHWFNNIQSDSVFEIDGEEWIPLPIIGGDYLIANRYSDGSVGSEFILGNNRYANFIVRKERPPTFANMEDAQRYVRDRNRIDDNTIFIPADTVSVLTSVLPDVLNEMLRDIKVYPYEVPSNLR